ncbi:MAG: tyrosine--tRNA ligase [Clostridia bacterium]|nr:tyrosine--tRNA ligase [Clostridia bacterium]
MANNIIEVLRERGFVKQTVYEEELIKMLGEKSCTFYVGFDPTADSLHIGHYIPLMAMAHMQRAGHRPIVLIGGGTAMVGDPSGRSDMRSMMTKETIDHNIECFKKQMARFLDFSEGKAIIVNNADWLLNLNYVDFLREIGSTFSVNKMLTAECFKQRLEKGLSFLEFNYMLMQAYDFLVLFREYACDLEFGGDDQWNNILAGADLIRRKEQKPSFAMTFPLLTTSDGIKMGKTQKGALWLDATKTTPYDFYQYWRNIEDESVNKCFKLLTFLPLEEIEELTKYQDERMNKAKIRLAYEITTLIHGKAIADEVQAQVEAAFSGDVNQMPVKEVPGVSSVIDVLVASGIAASRGEARRLIEGGGVSVDDRKIEKFDELIPDGLNDFILHKGKKTHVRIIVK